MVGRRRRPTNKRPIGTRIRVLRARKHSGRVSAWVVMCEVCGRIHGVDDEGKPVIQMKLDYATRVAASHGRDDHKGLAHVAVRGG